MKSHKNIIDAARARCGNHGCVKSLRQMGTIVDDLIGKIAKLKAENQRLRNDLKRMADEMAEIIAQDMVALGEWPG